MKTSSFKLMIIFLALAGVSLACALSGSGSPTVAPTKEPAAATQPPAAPSEAPSTATIVPTATVLPQGVYSPPSEAECQQIQGQAAGALKVAFSMEKGAFTAVDGQTGSACILKASGTGAQFKGNGEVVKALTKAFGDAIPDPSQAADGATGTMSGVWRGNTLLLMQSEWQPAPEANCPKDQPISACNVKPEQQLYTITIWAANSANPPILAGTAPTEAKPEKLPTVATSFVVDQSIRSTAGPMDVTINGSVSPGSYDRFRLALDVREGLDIQLASPQQTAGFMLLAPDGKPMPGTENQKAQWYSAGIDTAGEYAIIVSSVYGKADFVLSVKVKPGSGPTATATAGAAGAYSPLPAADCKQLRAAARAALGVTFTMSDADFSTAGETGTACTLIASGNGQNFASVAAAMSALQSAFNGWSIDSSYNADGATGAVRGFRSGNDLLVATVQWAPSADANCPQDQPITTCTLTPEQQIYTITIQAARK